MCKKSGCLKTGQVDLEVDEIPLGTQEDTSDEACSREDCVGSMCGASVAAFGLPCVWLKERRETTASDVFSGHRLFGSIWLSGAYIG